jgi:hypothetical protein
MPQQTPPSPVAPTGSDGLSTIQIDTNGRISMPGQQTPPNTAPPVPPASPTPSA